MNLVRKIAIGTGIFLTGIVSSPFLFHQYSILHKNLTEESVYRLIRDSSCDDWREKGVYLHLASVKNSPFPQLIGYIDINKNGKRDNPYYFLFKDGVNEQRYVLGGEPEIRSDLWLMQLEDYLEHTDPDKELCKNTRVDNDSIRIRVNIEDKGKEI